MTGRRRAAVLGHPIAHSLSPVLHRAAYAELDLDWDYRAIDMTSPRLPGFLDSLDDTWVGLSLTMPLKEAVLPLLDVISPLAASVAAVNTVVLADGRRQGFNTDVGGLRAVLRDLRITPGSQALVVGAGATARSAVAALVAEGVSAIGVSARRPAAVEDLRERIAGVSALPVAAPWPPRPAGWDIVVSTVPADVMADVLVEGPLHDLSSQLIDVVYDPWPTPLAAAWADAGGRAVGGLELLVHQAVEQLELMVGRRPDARRLRAAGLAALGRR